MENQKNGDLKLESLKQSKNGFGPHQTNGVVLDASSIEKQNGRLSEDLSARLSFPTEFEKERERETWDKPIEFLMICISCSVGLGNIWRFPFVAYENGGGAFLIPYLIVLFLIGKPLYYIELVMGQFSSHANVEFWNISPFFRGVGFGQFIASFCLGTYYSFLMGLCIYYFIVSLNPTALPWGKCNPDWANLSTCYNSDNTPLNNDYSSDNLTLNNSTGKWSSAELYFRNYVLKLTPSIDDGIGMPDFKLALCLLLAWSLVALTMIRGVKSAGKSAYFTALFPYVIMFTLLVRGCTLEGAWNGIKYFITPQWDALLKPKVWYAAISQSFFSLAVGFGGVILNASFNRFDHNVRRDATILSILDTLTSLLAGFTIFSILGHLAHTSGKEIPQVVEGGMGLAFISYPSAISQFTWMPQMFAAIFFLMLFTLGVGSLTTIFCNITTIIVDRFPNTNGQYVTVAVAIIQFGVGIVYCTPGGQFLIGLVDYFGTSFVIFIMTILEMVGINWVYGTNKFCEDIKFMLGSPVSRYCKFCWGFLIPVSLTVVLGYSMNLMEPLTYENKGYPALALAIGWSILIAALIQIPLWACIAVIKSPKSGLLNKLRDALHYNSEWGPRQPKMKLEWQRICNR